MRDFAAAAVQPEVSSNDLTDFLKPSRWDDGAAADGGFQQRWGVEGEFS